MVVWFGKNFYGRKKMDKSEINTCEEVSKRPEKKSGGSKFLLLFLVIFVLIFAVTGTGMIYSAHRKEKICSATAEGVVVRYREYTRNNHSHEYSPVVEYRVGNKILTGETNVWMSGRNFEEGVYVEIGYNPENPEEFYIRNYDLKTTYGMGMIFLAVSAGITLISILLLVLRRIHMEEKRKGNIQAAVLIGGSVLFIALVFVFLAGPVITLYIFGGMGLFVLFGSLWNKRKSKK